MPVSSPPCPICHKTFLARRSLLRHLRNVHGRHDHRELVPSNKAGHDVDRARNKLGRFVRTGEDSSTPSSPSTEENDGNIPDSKGVILRSATPTVTTNDSAETAPKPARKIKGEKRQKTTVPEENSEKSWIVETSAVSVPGRMVVGAPHQQQGLQVHAGLQQGGMGHVIMPAHHIMGPPMQSGPMMPGYGMSYMPTMAMPPQGYMPQYVPVPAVQYMRYPTMMVPGPAPNMVGQPGPYAMMPNIHAAAAARRMNHNG